MQLFCVFKLSILFYSLHSAGNYTCYLADLSLLLDNNESSNRPWWNSYSKQSIDGSVLLNISMQVHINLQCIRNYVKDMNKTPCIEYSSLVPFNNEYFDLQYVRILLLFLLQLLSKLSASRTRATQTLRISWRDALTFPTWLQKRYVRTTYTPTYVNSYTYSQL